jgi:hypothetical protein
LGPVQYGARRARRLLRGLLRAGQPDLSGPRQRIGRGRNRYGAVRDEQHLEQPVHGIGPGQQRSAGSEPANAQFDNHVQAVVRRFQSGVDGRADEEWADQPLAGPRRVERARILNAARVRGKDQQAYEIREIMAARIADLWRV